MIRTNNIKPAVSLSKTFGWLLLFCSAGAIATTPDAVMHPVKAAVAQTANAAQENTTELTKATVRKIDLAQNKITLKHEAIENISMPAMTMVFKVADPLLLQGIAVGDEVQFAAEKQDRQLLITALEKQQKP